MANWTASLERILPRPCLDRPLVCDGFPDASEVIIIGENPATDMKTDWWSYWDRQEGFDYARFIADYKRARVQQGKSELSNTRLRLRRIRENGIGAVETNAYRNQQPGGAGRGVTNYSLLNILIKNMPNLNAVIAYGEHAKAFVAEANLPTNLRIFLTKHFRFVSYADVDDICRVITSLSKN